MLLSIRISQNRRTVLLFAAAFVFGAAGWSGKTSLNFLALLYPFVYLQSRRRIDASQLCGLLRGGHMERHSRFSELLWHWGKPCPSPAHLDPLVALSAAPWIAFYNRGFFLWRRRGHRRTEHAPAQPRHGCTPAHLCVAQWFPGTRWLGLYLPLVLILAYRRLGTAFTFSSARRGITRSTCSFPPSTARSTYRCREHPFRRSTDTRRHWLHIARPGRGHAANSSRAPGYAHPFSGVDHPYLDSNA